MKQPIDSGRQDAETIELVRKCVAGDLAAFRALMQSYQPYATAIAFRLLRDEEDAKDIVQDAFLRVWNHLAEYRSDVKFTTWLYKIVVNLCYDKMKMRSRRNSLFAFFSGGTDAEEFADKLNIHEEMEHKDMMTTILSAAKSLPPMEHLVFHLRDVEDFSVDEVAEITGISPGSVKTNLCYARKRIRFALERLQKSEGI